MSKISRKETKAMDTNAQIICANLVSGFCTAPLVDEVFNSIGSYLPLHKFQIAVSSLANMGEYQRHLISFVLSMKFSMGKSRTNS